MGFGNYHAVRIETECIHEQTLVDCSEFVVVNIWEYKFGRDTDVFVFTKIFTTFTLKLR